MNEMKAYLIKYRKDDIAENVLRRLLTYSLGRELTYADRFAVEELLEVSERREHRFQDMIVSICKSKNEFGAFGSRARLACSSYCSRRRGFLSRRS